ncbi:MAG: hypothetical protein ILA34_06275 [Bacteroidaceae bacterium]|nr:hypothetical protein [Bacteroidaceae bacterium]
MHTVEAKRILTAYRSGMNVYRGCTHGCIYCDVRSQVYGFTHPMEDVEAKANAPALLADALSRRRRKYVITTGAMGDPYQPCEARLGLTRQCLQVILRHGFGVSPHTKSTLLLRDIDLLAAINERAKCVVQTTLTCMDDGLSRLIEPHVSTTLERINMLSQLQGRGIPTVVWLCPVLSHITDTPRNVRAIVRACADTGVHGIVCFHMGLTLRQGDREHYYLMLDRHFPGLRERYVQDYGDAYWCLSPRHAELMALFHEECEAAGMLHDNDAIFRYLSHLPAQATQLELF